METVVESARILTQQFATFNQLVSQSEESTVVLESPKTDFDSYDMPLDQLHFSMRTLNALRRGGIINMGNLLGKNREDLLDLRNFGLKSWNEVQARLFEMGLGDESTLAQEEEIIEKEESGELTPAGKEISELKRKLKEKFTVRDDK